VTALTALALRELGLALDRDAISSAGQLAQDLADAARGVLRGDLVDAMKGSGALVCRVLAVSHPTEAMRLQTALDSTTWVYALIDHSGNWQDAILGADKVLVDLTTPAAHA
jgi:hypothetical protein